MSGNWQPEPIDFGAWHEAMEGADEGPWHVVDYGDGDGDSLVIHSGRDWRICFMATPGSSPGAMKKIRANATFIARCSPSDISGLLAAIEGIERRARAAEQDAMRYRWLREQARVEHRDGATNGTWRITGIPAYDQYEKAAFDHETFDAAVDAATLSSPATPEPALAGGVRVKALEWSDAAPPNDQYRYDHVVAETPFGSYSIEWKSWKPHDSYTVYHNGAFLLNGRTLDEAKAAAQADFDKRILSSLSPASGGADHG